MAFASAGFKLAVTFIDNGGNKTTRSYDLTAADNATAETDTATILLILQAVSDAVITDYYWYEKIIQDALTLPASGVQIENLALMEFTLAGDPTKKATQTIPAPKPSIFNTLVGGGANIVNTANAAVVNFGNMFITGAAQKATLSDGETAATLDKGQRIHRKSRRG